jgi:hypothetical protein
MGSLRSSCGGKRTLLGKNCSNAFVVLPISTGNWLTNWVVGAWTNRGLVHAARQSRRSFRITERRIVLFVGFLEAIPGEVYPVFLSLSRASL